MSAIRHDETLPRRSVDDVVVRQKFELWGSTTDRSVSFFFYLRQSHKFLRQTSTDKEFLTMLSMENFL